MQTKHWCERLYRELSSLLSTDQEDADWRLLLSSLRAQCASTCNAGYSCTVNIIYTVLQLRRRYRQWCVVVSAFGFLI